MVGWTKSGSLESIGVHIDFLHMKLNFFKFFLYKFFVVHEIQQNQKNYDIDFKFLIKINIKTNQNLVKI
jgi:hypothetical protein